jgi:propionyl-CoA carboxylase beta chain
MKDILQELESVARLPVRAAAKSAGRGPARQGQADRARTHRTAARRRQSFEEFDMFVAHRCTDFGMQDDRPRAMAW